MLKTIVTYGNENGEQRLIVLETVNNQRKIPISDEYIEVIGLAAEYTVKKLGVKVPLEAELNFFGARRMREINFSNRGKNKVTDVLSFPFLVEKQIELVKMYDGGKYLPDCLNHASGRITLGTIVICPEAAQKQADEIGQSFIREAVFLTVHSMLHLFGYDHETSYDDEKKMFSLQKEITDEFDADSLLRTME